MRRKLTAGEMIVRALGHARGHASLALLVVLTALLVASPATASGNSLPSARYDAAATDRYWTPERMREARPLPLPSPTGSVAQRGSASSPIRGEPRLVPPVPPSATGDRRQLAASTGETGETVTTQSDVSFTSGGVAKPRASPQRTHGKLFLGRNGSDGTCSATAVVGKVRTVVLTAGHCLYFESRWSRRPYFVPAYDGGERPFGTFASNYGVVTEQWRKDQNLNYDLGVLRVRTNERGKTLRQAVGARGVAWNQPRTQTFESFGYPQNMFATERMVACQSAYAGPDPHADPFGPAPVSMGCDMRKGASGGGWVIANRYVNSVTSYFYADEPNHLYGPYFGQAAKRLWSEASG